MLLWSSTWVLESQRIFFAVVSDLLGRQGVLLDMPGKSRRLKIRGSGVRFGGPRWAYRR